MPVVVQEQFAHDAQTTLSAEVTSATQTSIAVTSATAFPTAPVFRIRVSTEIMLVTAGAGTTTWTVARGQEGTTALASIANGTVVEQVFTAEAMRRWVNDYLPQPRHNRIAAWTGDTSWGQQGGSALASGVVYLHRFYVPEAVTIANMLLFINTAGATLSAGQNQCGLYDSAGALIARNGDTATAWQTTGLKTHALTVETGKSLNLARGEYWAAIISNGTTKPVMRNHANVGDLLNAGLAAADKLRAGTSGSALTALPATVTLTTLASSTIATYWAGFV